MEKELLDYILMKVVNILMKVVNINLDTKLLMCLQLVYI